MPHLAAPGTVRDDLVLADAAAEPFLSEPVEVEEKLDGMNVCIWVDDGAPQVATRGGADSMDRSGQRGRIRGWAAERADGLRGTLGFRWALYGEWLLFRHTLGYSGLPAPLVGLDFIDRGTLEFASTDERDRLLTALELPSPPRLFQGTLGTLARARALTERESVFGAPRVEGIVIRRRPDQDPRLCKLLADGFSEERREPAGSNRLATSS